MNIITLKSHPDLFEKTLTLIEKSFQYSKSNSFKIDFAPLINEKNHENCFVMIDKDDVVAHIGYLEKEIVIKNESFKIGLLGGISVDEKFRGEGHFTQLMTHVLSEKRDEVAFFLLWSDLEKLYNKFGFFLCGNQFEVEQKNGKGNFEKTKYHLLSQIDQKKIQSLYQNSFSKANLTFNRTEKDWSHIAEITSADLFLKKESNKISNYFFMNKGQDLPEIIYGYGNFEPEMSFYGKVWMGAPLVETENIQYEFFLSPGATKVFGSFIKAYTNDQVTLRDINLIKQEAYFDFNGETLSLETEDFLRGIFGPGSFEEFGELSPLFISGLDSI